jgi:hypothetical protein
VKSPVKKTRQAALSGGIWFRRPTDGRGLLLARLLLLNANPESIDCFGLYTYVTTVAENSTFRKSSSDMCAGHHFLNEKPVATLGTIKKRGQIFITRQIIEPQTTG